MLIVTIRSALEELKPLGPGSGEVIICDNSDPFIYKQLASALPTGYIKGGKGSLKVFRQDFPCIFTARETTAEKASGDYILCLDSHMICGRDMIVDLVTFMDKASTDPTIGFAHAPINWAHQHERSSRHDRDMTTCELGDWGAAYSHIRPITWKGMPWICRREWFLDKKKGLGGYGALAEHKLSWGGGDMHIGIKPWLLGFKNWAVPTSPGIHIGPFPKIDIDENPNITKIAPSAHSARGPQHISARDKYRVYSVSGEGPHALGFLVSCYVLGGEAMMLRNKQAIINRFQPFINVEQEWEKAKRLGEAEKQWLDSRKVMSFEQLLERKPWND